MQQIKKEWLHLLIVGVVGIALGVAGTQAVSQSRPASLSQKQVPSNESFHTLRAIDDQIILSCGDGFGTVSNIFQAQANLDTTKVSQGIKTLQTNVQRMNDLVDERSFFLDKLNQK